MCDYDTSFLKRMQVVINGDVESNPGPGDTEKNPIKARGRPKGTPKKGKGFKGTPKRLKVNEVDNEISEVKIVEIDPRFLCKDQGIDQIYMRNKA